MSELFRPDHTENEPRPTHPLFEVARKSLTSATEAMMRGKFNIPREYQAFYQQLERAFPELYAQDDLETPIPEREMPLILAVCQKIPAGVPLDDYFIGIPFCRDNDENVRRVLRPGNSLVATMYGDITETIKRDHIYTRFLNDRDRLSLPRYFNPD